MVLVLKKGASKKEMELLTKKLSTKKGNGPKKNKSFIKLKESPMSIQKKLRDEWN
jgi:hypothetical protein